MKKEWELIRVAQTLLASGGTLESGLSTERLTEEQIAGAVEMQLQYEEARLAAREGRAPEPQTAVAAAGEMLRHARTALTKSSNLSDAEFASLEAIVQVIGRPALRFVNDDVESPNNQLRENQRWHVIIADTRKHINAVARSVGRLLIEDGSVTADTLAGTGWRIGSTLLVTNRHVALRLKPGKSVVDFGAVKAAVVKVEYITPNQDLRDIALLRLSDPGTTLPAALPLDWSIKSVEKGAEVYVIGHPWRSHASSETLQVFGEADGGKRFAPGYITALDPIRPFFEHDCSTLNGNSGSCVLNTLRQVIGLHFASRGVEEASALGVANAALALGRLETSDLTALLRGGAP